MGKGTLWSQEDLANLKKVWASGETIKSQMHLFPGRSPIAVRCAARVHKLPKKKRGFISWVRPAVLEKLRRAPGLTATELRISIGCSYAAVKQILDMMRVAPKKRVRVSGWRRAGSLWVECWSLGTAADLPKPPRQSPADRRRIDRVRHQRASNSFNPFATAIQQVVQEAA
jgi:hypothetical protein